MSIVIAKGSGHAIRLEPTGVKDEDFLQRFVAENPHCLPVDEIEDDLALSIVAREFPTGSGPIDVLALDQNGGVYLIETKLYKNPDKRHVVAQVLDYAASIWANFSDADEFRQQLDACARNLKAKSLNEILISDLGVEPDQCSKLVASAAQNCEDGAFRFLVLMDRMGDRLKRLIRYVNRFCRFDLYGVEFEFYEHDDLHIAIPRLYGTESVKVVDGGRSTWNEDKYFDHVQETLGDKGVQALRPLFDHCVNSASSVTWGTGRLAGSFNPKYDSVSQKSVLTAYSDGNLALSFGWHPTEGEPFERLMKFRSLIEKELSISIPEDKLKTGYTLSFDAWSPHVQNICEAISESFC